ncbi:hypothetical protein CR513_14291, partial [Mucuna pruriens]
MIGQTNVFNGLLVLLTLQSHLSAIIVACSTINLNTNITPRHVSLHCYKVVSQKNYVVSFHTLSACVVCQYSKQKKLPFPSIDDMSRFTWIKLMKANYETRQHLDAFVTLIEAQFNIKIKVVQSDNGQEFLHPSFYESKGIVNSPM